MKKYLLLIFLFYFTSIVYADNEVYLDLNISDIHSIKTFTTNYENSKKNNTDDWSEEKDMIIHPFQYIKDELINDYKKNH